jgi:tetratricopeptide (TPR) repeat protein
MALAELGRLDEGWALGEEGLRIAEAVDRPVDVILAAWGPGVLAVRRGQYALAIAPLERGLTLCRTGRFPRYLPWTAGLLGYLRVLQGKPPDGVALLEEAVEQAESRRLLLGHSLLSMWLADARLASGDSAEALGLANRALDLTRQREERGNEAWALHVLGRTASTTGDLETAEARFGESLARATELGMGPLAARCHLGLGEIHRRARKAGRARDQLTAAIDMFRGMGMERWQVCGEAELAAIQ